MFGKSVWKTNKNNWRSRGKNEASENLKPKEQRKVTKDKPEDKNNRSRVTVIFNDLINKQIKRMDFMKVLIRINYILSM